MGKKAARVIERFEAARLYAVTCPPLDKQGYESMVEAACRGGVDILQFRDKSMNGQERFRLAYRLRCICERYGVLFVVNDALEVALSVGADGVHLGQDDLPLPAARELVHRLGVKNFMIGISTHSLAQALAAEKDGADYIGIGPVFATPTKPAYEPVGIDLVRQVTGLVSVPQVAIGGIDAGNLPRVLEAGARRVAVVRAVCGAHDIEIAARELKAAIPSKETVEAS